jgi:topoisomerase-4 subunit B
VREGHLYIFDTPLFRVRDKKQTFYCYTDRERHDAIAALRGKAEITRFKGLGEISPGEFGAFIGDDIRLELVQLHEDTNIEAILEYYMGKNTPERQDFIIENLKVEIDELSDEEKEEQAILEEEAAEV